MMRVAYETLSGLRLNVYAPICGVMFWLLGQGCSTENSTEAPSCRDISVKSINLDATISAVDTEISKPTDLTTKTEVAVLGTIVEKSDEADCITIPDQNEFCILEQNGTPRMLKISGVSETLAMQVGDGVSVNYSKSYTDTGIASWGNTELSISGSNEDLIFWFGWASHVGDLTPPNAALSQGEVECIQDSGSVRTTRYNLNASIGGESLDLGSGETATADGYFIVAGVVESIEDSSALPDSISSSTARVAYGRRGHR